MDNSELSVWNLMSHPLITIPPETIVSAVFGIAADKGGVYLITRGQCGTETQVAVRIKGAGSARRLELIETRYRVEL